MAWACSCWRDGGGLVISSLSLTADEAAFRGCRVFGGLEVVGQNDRGVRKPEDGEREAQSAQIKDNSALQYCDIIVWKTMEQARLRANRSQCF
ncbi:hypothetical protein NDU88_006516 [Pleurodeles waltl]|uniref:Uncharacterized protein n=1 Tax=Pleurodeles waltl TaxID=8319 RepID=A0AAV7UP85_PLEWA|nr:hypothetical protein NDU88_006516 [Pleurodeles waltl]